MILSNNSKAYARALETGEPTTIIRTGALMNLAVQHPNNVAVGLTHVAVTNEAGIEPVPNAVVCLYKEGDVHSAYTTDASGAVGFDISPSSTGDITITVYGHGVVPYSNTIEVTP